MIETSSIISRKISAIFEKLRQSCGMFPENVRKRLSGLRTTFGLSSEIFGKCAKIFGKSSKSRH